jgi:hypothetical protein
MARNTIISLSDDLDGSAADLTVEFSYKGKTYSLDLNERNASELEDALAPYIAAAEKAGGVRTGRSGGRSTRSGGPSRSRSSSSSAGDVDPKQVRAWAQANGVDVSPRGRIAASVLEQYRNAGA